MRSEEETFEDTSLRTAYHALEGTLSDFVVRQILINNDKTEGVRKPLRILTPGLHVAEIYSEGFRWEKVNFDGYLISLIPVSHEIVLCTRTDEKWIFVYRNFKEVQKLPIPCPGVTKICNGVVCVNCEKTLELFSLEDVLVPLTSVKISRKDLGDWSVQALGKDRLLISGDKQAYLTSDLAGRKIEGWHLNAFIPEGEGMPEIVGLESLQDPANFRFALSNTSEPEFHIYDFSSGEGKVFQTIQGSFGKTLSENTFSVTTSDGGDGKIWSLGDSKYFHVQDLALDYLCPVSTIPFENAFALEGNVYIQTRWKGFVKEMDLGEKEIYFLLPSGAQVKKLSKRLEGFMEGVPLDVVEVVTKFV